MLGAFVLFVGLQAAKYPIGMYMTDKTGLTFQVAPILVMVPLTLGLSWFLIGEIGAAGPVLGSAIAVALCQVVPNLWYVSRDLSRRRAEADRQAAPEASDSAEGDARTPEVVVHDAADALADDALAPDAPAALGPSHGVLQEDEADADRGSAEGTTGRPSAS